ncbi:hypothetical protein A7U43_14155 [Mycobacterium adipatum]|jgi:hypothetical protein|uniref:Uncharacterized protein n=1 Tax=Mycobacterium adipatum TaxID=1682113 RepID=A0A172UML6_9MYCO|nr:Ig-like domain-containing protein [Mycobacterium adipatum]ANE80301.1 hypothetical protein A7U43_14155 [Mycobacterium adipatum]MBI5735859.1 hypothetical protein [Mycolicibacterium neoaurum]
MAGKHRTETSPPAVAVWLGTGAIALGIGAALTTGTAVASADTGDTGGTKSSSQSSGVSAGPTAKRTAPRSVATARTHRTPSPKADTTEDDATDLAPSARSLTATARTSATAAATFDPFAALEKAFRKTFINTAPTNAGSSGPVRNDDGTFTGQVIATDVDDDPLNYSIGYTGPSGGTATVAADGTWTYTPGAELATNGGRDSFVIRIVEANAGTHLHGLNEFTALLFDPLYQLLNYFIPQNRFKFPKYNPQTYAYTEHYVGVTVPPGA